MQQELDFIFWTACFLVVKTFLTVSFLLCLPVCSLFANEAHGHEDHGHEPAAGGDGLFEPFEHLHYNRLGTPIVHSFGVEPAFTGRDLFGDYRFRSGDELTVHAFELELEWAFTRRLGIIVEIPCLLEDEDGGTVVDGFGDLAFVPRVILFEKDRFVLTSQIEIVAPTGTNDLGGETAIAPGIVSWFDLGDWWTLNTQVAVEHIFDEDVTDFIFGLGLVKTFGHDEHASIDNHGHSSAAGLINLHLEVTGSVGISGEDEGIVNAEGLLGISYGASSNIDVRAGFEFPLSSPNDFDGGLVTGFVWHF